MFILTFDKSVFLCFDPQHCNSEAYCQHWHGLGALDKVHRPVLVGRKQILSAEGIIISLESASLSVFSILKQLGYFFRILLLYHHRRKIFLNLRNLSINSVMPFEQDKDKDKAAFFIET